MQPSKTGFLYVFDRVTGEPVWPIEERAVPPGNVPGEWYAPTQPFPTKPPAFERQGMSVDELIDFTPELRAEQGEDEYVAGCERAKAMLTGIREGLLLRSLVTAIKG